MPFGKKPDFPREPTSNGIDVPRLILAFGLLQGERAKSGRHQRIARSCAFPRPPKRQLLPQLIERHVELVGGGAAHLVPRSRGGGGRRLVDWLWHAPRRRLRLQHRRGRRGRRKKCRDRRGRGGHGVLAGRQLTGLRDHRHRREERFRPSASRRDRRREILRLRRSGKDRSQIGKVDIIRLRQRRRAARRRTGSRGSRPGRWTV